MSEKKLKIILLSVLNGIDNFGIRKLASHIRSIHHETELFFLTPGKHRGLVETLLMKGESDLGESEISEIADALCEADIVGISSMTGYAPIVKRIIKSIRKRTQVGPYIVWGGIHPIVNPEDAIQAANAICTGEGEFAFEIFLEKFQKNQFYYDSPSFWFNTPDGVLKNKNMALMTSNDMSKLPSMFYQDGEKIYKKKRGFVEITNSDIIEHCSIFYHTIWTIGCPLHCTYCSNSVFIKNDPNYCKLRFSSPHYIIQEIKRAIGKSEFITGVVFNDDSFLALNIKILSEFAMLYKQEINLPFAVVGVIPEYVQEEKIKVLVDAGMNRVRMGIQSGSPTILDFYKRPSSVKSIKSAAHILNRFKRQMIPPAYDIILDNPIETREDTLATLDLIYALPRPFTLNIFSLRVIPNTQLEKDLLNAGVMAKDIQSSNYWKNIPSFGNCLIYLLTLLKPPRSLYHILRKHVKPSSERQALYPNLMLVLRFLYLAKRALWHFMKLDFSTLPGWPGFYLHRFIKKFSARQIFPKKHQ